MIDIDHLRELRRKGPDGWWSAEAFGPGQNRIYAHDSDWALPWVAGAGTWSAFEYIGALHNAFPALASELEAARKVVAAGQARNEAWVRWVMAKGPWAGPEWVELDRLTVEEKDALRAYDRVMEEQR